MQTWKFILLTICTIPFVFTACTPEDDEIITLPGEAIVLDCRYDDAITLTDHNPDGVDYIVECFVEIFGGAMVIEPGVTIVFEDDGGFDVAIDGSLSAVGTAAQPITMRGATPGVASWRGIVFITSDVNNRLEYVNISDAGTTVNYALFDDPVAVGVVGTLSMNNTSITNSKVDGMLIYEEGAEILSFSNNIISNSGRYPIIIETGELSKMDLASCSFKDNGENVIAYEARGNRLYGEHVWVDPGVPFRQLSEMQVWGDLSLEAGVEIEMIEGTLLAIVSTIDEEYNLTINGTSDRPVVIRGKESFPAYWSGIEVNSNSVKNVFTHLVVSDGGKESLTWSDLKGNIQVWGGNRLTLNSVVSSNAEGCDVVLMDHETITFTATNSNALNICED
ncbi:MAG: hypothetical protein AAGH79_13570 [Bacteroidota bacterium]